MTLYCDVRDGNPDEPALVLLHGLGANGAVWNRVLSVLAGRWRGRIVVPDFRGHGRSPIANAYGLGEHAADVADLLSPGEPVVVAGHSMGGAVAVALATGWFAVDVRSVLALSVKPEFTADEIEKGRTFAAKPRARFATFEDAAERFRRAGGLTDIDAGDEAIAAGVRADGGGFTLAADPRTVLVAGPPFAPMLRAAQAPVALVTGERDEVAGVDALRACAGDVTVVSGAGHNVHVERPDAIAELILAMQPQAAVR